MSMRRMIIEILLLIKASLYDCVELVKILLKVEGINANEKSNDGNTALMLASAYGRLEIVEELLKMENININHTNNHGQTALSRADVLADDANPANTEAIRALLREHGALELDDIVNASASA